MDEIAAGLAHNVLSIYDVHNTARRCLLGLAGVPGSGKSTLAARLTARINEACPGSCACISMDGWHYPRSHLDRMVDPSEAYRRRGAAFTFDAEAFVAFVRRARVSLNETIRAPSFSHAEKDPVPDAILIEPSHRILLFEGLYCCLDVEPWVQAARCWDLAWFLDVPRDIARARLIRRHVDAGIAPNEAAAAERGMFTHTHPRSRYQ